MGGLRSSTGLAFGHGVASHTPTTPSGLALNSSQMLLNSGTGAGAGGKTHLLNQKAANFSSSSHVAPAGPSADHSTGYGTSKQQHSALNVSQNLGNQNSAEARLRQQQLLVSKLYTHILIQILKFISIGRQFELGNLAKRHLILICRLLSILCRHHPSNNRRHRSTS